MTAGEGPAPEEFGDGWVAGAARRTSTVVAATALVGFIGGAAAAATLLVSIMVLVQPLAGKRRYQKLIERIRRDPGARLRHYYSGMAASWAYVAAVAVVGGFAGRGPASIGLTTGTEGGDAVATGRLWVLSAAIGLVLSVVLIWVIGPTVRRPLRRQLRGFADLLPRTSQERSVFAAVAVTAGICEEILYRGFGLAYLRWLAPGLGHLGSIWVVGAAFGLAHLYQGWRNVIVTGLVGGLFASMTLSTGTLLPAIAIHALVDLRVCFLPSDLVESPASEAF